MINKTQLELCKRIKAYRIYNELTQQELADKTGLSLRSINNLESGKDVQLSTLLSVLKYLGLEENMLLVVPNLDERPSIQIQKAKGLNRQRVKKKKADNKTFLWGDER